MKFYRYKAVQYAVMGDDGDLTSSRLPNPVLEVEEYNLHKETPKGYWIGYGLAVPGHLRGYAKWVSKTARKRFAYPTKKEALVGFIAKKKRQVKILKYQLTSAQMMWNEANKLLEKLSK